MESEESGAVSLSMSEDTAWVQIKRRHPCLGLRALGR